MVPEYSAVPSPTHTAIMVLGLATNGIDLDFLGVHSLRGSGATALKFAGENDTTIVKNGRWSGLTFLQYIRSQIGHLSKDLALKMSQPVPFLNIASIS
jgi:hypothetical protein